MSKKLANVEVSKKNLALTTQTPLKNRVIINFKYLYKCDVACFKELGKKFKKHNWVFDELQKFLYEADQCLNIEAMIGMYTSRNGSKIDRSNNFVNRILKKFMEVYPNDKGIVSKNLIHIHTRRNGTGSFVIFGVHYENTFYVLGFDPLHEFEK